MFALWAPESILAITFGADSFPQMPLRAAIAELECGAHVCSSRGQL